MLYNYTDTVTSRTFQSKKGTLVLVCPAKLWVTPSEKVSYYKTLGNQGKIKHPYTPKVKTELRMKTVW